MNNTWTLSPFNKSMWRIAYGAGKFVGAGIDQELYYSTDGISWTTIALPAIWAGTKFVAYGNGKFVIIRSGSDVVFYSTDGVTWNTSSLPSALPSSNGDLIYGNKFVMQSDNKVYKSTDGISWTESALPTPASGTGWRRIAYGNSTYMIISDSDKVLTSTDATAWTEYTIPYLPGIYDNSVDTTSAVGFHNGLFIVTGRGSMGMLFSPNGTTWSGRNTPIDGISDGSAIKSNGNIVISVNYFLTEAEYSLDCVTWNTFNLTTDITDWRALALSPTRAVAGGMDDISNYIDLDPVIGGGLTLTTTPTSMSVNEGQTVTVTAITTGGTGAVSFRWLLNGNTVSTTGSYVYTANLCGTTLTCTARDSITTITVPVQIQVNNTLVFPESIKCLSSGWKGYNIWNTKVNQTYNSNNYFVNNVADKFIFNGSYLMSNCDVRRLYNSWRTLRGNQFTITDGDFGVHNMFGPSAPGSSHIVIINRIEYEITSPRYKMVNIELIKVG